MYVLPSGHTALGQQSTSGSKVVVHNGLGGGEHDATGQMSSPNSQKQVPQGSSQRSPCARLLPLLSTQPGGSMTPEMGISSID